jgi:hypothetical protein
MKADLSRLTFGHEKHYHGVIKQQGRVDIDADWNEQNEIASWRVETEAVDVIGACGAPVDDAGFTLTATSGGANINISKGRAYVDGLLCENEQDVLITNQPDLPGFVLPTAAGVYIAYLEVWLRHLTALDDAEIREVALGGPDTCSRTKTIWQVNLLDVAAAGTNVTCATPEPKWDALIAPSSGKLAAQVVPTPASSPCGIAAAGGYTSLQNQLYRVEIHDPSSGTASFKWSRDNGSVVASWTAQAGANNEQLTIASNGPDDALGFAPGQWIELVSNANELNFQPGVLAPLTGVSGNTLTIDPSKATGAVTGFKFPAKIRRWDSAGRTSLTTGQWLDLENGVQVQFSPGTFATGDYWLIPARTLTASVDWPTNASGQPIALSPKGIKRHYCKLAVLNLDGSAWSIAATCLPTFPPLTKITPGQDKAIHATGVQLTPGNAPLLNDSDMLAISLVEVPFGLVVACDAPIDPVSARPTSCYVEAETPYPLMDKTIGTGSSPFFILGNSRLLLPGTVSVAGSSITWKLENPFGLMRILFDVLSAMRRQQGDARIRLRLVLKGDLIWGLNDPTTYLDGDAFGSARTDADGSKRISLNFPSGDGKRGGDFEFWFWLFLPVTPDGVTFANLPSPIFAGQTSTGTVTLNGPAPTAGAVVTLTSQALGANGGVLTGVKVATIPASVTILAGQTSNTFPVTGTSVPAGMQSVTLRVTAAYENGQAVGDLVINQVLGVASINLNPAALLADGQKPITGTVTLSGPAPAGGALVALVYDNPAFATVTPQGSVTVAAGQTTSPTFSVFPRALPTNSNTVTVKVAATYNNSSKSTSFDIIAQKLT